jgi:ubiquinone/menaquinone biosynthesis C-methylase UbiE
VTAIDFSEVFIGHARDAEKLEPLGIVYHIGSAVELPFADESFDFATSFMCFMDVPETDKVLSEAYRILRPGGFLQFSICHPCYDTPHRRLLRNEEGEAYAVEVGGYFRNREGDVTEWLFGAAPKEAKAGLPKFKTPIFTRTLSQWFNMLVDTGFTLERVGEPTASDETVKECPDMQDTQIVAYYLHIRVRKT